MAFAALALGNTAYAQANSYTNVSGSKWETPSNWSLGVAPTNSHLVFITNASPKIVTIDAITATAFPFTMTVSNVTVNANTLQLTNASAAVFRIFSVLSLQTNATTIINNSTLQADGGLEVGAFGSGNNLIITNAGKLVTSATTIGGLPGFSNTVVVTGAGSVWVNTNSSLNIRNSLEGTAVAVVAGGKAVVGNVFLGNSASANRNSILVTGPGSVWSNTGTLNIGGSSSEAQFIVSNSATAFSTRAVIGDPLGTSHSALITGTNSLWFSDNTIVVGNGSVLNIADGGALIVSNASHTGLLKIDGASLFVDGTFAPDNLILTNASLVTYNQPIRVDNATVIYGGVGAYAESNLLVASTANSTGSVAVVAGILIVEGVLGVGNNGTLTSGGGIGKLTISNGTLSAVKILLGSSAGGHGTLTVQTGGAVNFTCPAGPDCLLSVNEFRLQGGFLDMGNGSIKVGVASDGAMFTDSGTANCLDVTVGDSFLGSCSMSGGRMNLSSVLVVGNAASATGIVSITGGDWASSSSSTIGNNGVGNLSISNATVSMPFVVISNPNRGTLTIAGGTMFTTNLLVGGIANSTGTVWLTGGNLNVTNTNPTGTLVVGRLGRGVFTLSNGVLTADQLFVTNGSKSTFNFIGGTLQCRRIVVSNTTPFLVGNGLSPAQLQLLSDIGTNIFANGIQISAKATLTGCGTNIGGVVNNGTIATGCPGAPLVFIGPVTNNATMQALNGGLLNFLGPVVNNGFIDATAGGVVFQSTLTGPGVVLAPPLFLQMVGINVVASVPSVVGASYQLQQRDSLTAGGWNNVGASTNGTGALLQLPDLGGATNKPSRFYRVRIGP